MSEVPERVYMDPDIKFPECEKRYGCDIEYVRGDLVEAAVKKLGDSLVAAEAKLAKAVEALDLTDHAIMEKTTDHDLLMWGEPTVSHIRDTIGELKGEQL